MQLTSLPHVSQLALGLAALYLLYTIVTSVSLWQQRRAFKRAHGALDAPQLPQKGFYGISTFRENFAAVKEHRLLEWFRQRFVTVGSNTVQLEILGRQVISTCEPENLKTILALDFKKWRLSNVRTTSFWPLLGEGIFTTNGHKWQTSRNLLRPNFVRNQVADMGTFEKHVTNLIAAIPRDGSTVDLAELFFRLTVDSATEFLFGESTHSLLRSDDAEFAGAFNRSQAHVAQRTRYGFWARFVPSNNEFEKDRKFVHDFVDYYVARGLKAKQQADGKSVTDRYVFVDGLLEHTSDPVRIRSELLNILVAGRDTTASLLSNVWWALSHYPHVWKRLQDELAALDGQEPTFEQLKDFKYLKATMNEALRLWPVVPLNSREATEDTILPLGGGPDGTAPLFVRKGRVVNYSVYAMQRRTDLFGSDADEFRPERWLDEPDSDVKGIRPGWEFLPFNGGPRICLGQQFALTEASYTTVRLCQAFSGIESRLPGEWRESLTLTCVSGDGAKVALTPRKL